MNEKAKSELFEGLAALARRYPNWRVGQLICNVAGWANEEVWDVEDERLLEATKEHLNSTADRAAELRA